MFITSFWKHIFRRDKKIKPTNWEWLDAEPCKCIEKILHNENIPIADVRTVYLSVLGNWTPDFYIKVDDLITGGHFRLSDFKNNDLSFQMPHLYIFFIDLPGEDFILVNIQDRQIYFTEEPSYEFHRLRVNKQLLLTEFSTLSRPLACGYLVK